MKELQLKALDFLKCSNSDSLAISKIDFKNSSFESFEIVHRDSLSVKPFLYFDLASISKVLNLASVYIMKPELFSKEMLLLLNHRAELPAWGRLSRDGWREQLLNYKIKESETLYSDFSALRLMLEIEKKSNKSLKELSSAFWDKDLLFYRDLKKEMVTPVTGVRNGEWVEGVVHDDNSFVIGDFTSHAGMFATVDGLSKSLINLNDKFNLIDKMEKEYKSHDGSRFIAGWDRAENLDNTLAPKNSSKFTFGHLGFTGTSVWIDAEKKMGLILLTNETAGYWYSRELLNNFRKEILF